MKTRCIWKCMPLSCKERTEKCLVFFQPWFFYTLTSKQMQCKLEPPAYDTDFTLSLCPKSLV